MKKSTASPLALPYGATEIYYADSGGTPFGRKIGQIRGIELHKATLFEILARIAIISVT